VSFEKKEKKETLSNVFRQLVSVAYEEQEGRELYSRDATQIMIT